MVPESLKQLYCVNFAQAFSSESNLLAVGSSEGKIVVFDASNLFSEHGSRVDEKIRKPEQVFNAHNTTIYSMLSAAGFCITGTTGNIAGWKWDNLKKDNPQMSWSIALDGDQSNFGTPEVNSLAYSHTYNHLYAACGDWRTHVYDIETGKRSHILEGHEDYIHDVVISGNLVTTSGEDGAVLVWDPRAGREPQHKLFPYTLPLLARPQLGKFIASVDLNNEWLVCGGGPKAGIFHLRSLALTTVLPPSPANVHTVQFTPQIQGCDRGSIVIAGTESCVYCCSMNGDVAAKIPSSSPCVYSVMITHNPSTLMTMCGLSRMLDVCLNLNYRHHTVALAG
ncbi:THO complex subunit 6 [Oratosquilla oratoria]|uniref:THO complex subunit 6 n=1 Tax=Oratosquilla oratoria TaxID=337810 RepID=UPI003F76B582